MRLLVIDIETAPGLGHVWGLWNQNISITQLQESGYMLSFASKWAGEKKIEFRSIHHDGKEEMLARVHELMTEADAIIHWNGNSFDIKVLNGELWLAGYSPPAPSKQIDLMRVVKQNFRFMSNKLDYIAQIKGLRGKLKHGGHEMWVKCMLGDPKAWAVMKRYNRQDVSVTEELYWALLPWINNHPHRGLYDGTKDCCSNCGSSGLVKEGFEYTAQGKYQRFHCRNCGKWGKSGKRLDGVSVVGVKA